MSPYYKTENMGMSLKTSRFGGVNLRKIFLFFSLFLFTVGVGSLFSCGVATANAQSISKTENKEPSRDITLSIGKSVQLNLSSDVKDVVVANPKVANAIVRSIRNIFIVGLANGATTVIAHDANGNQIAAYNITVGRDLSLLRQTLASAIPNSRISVEASGGAVILTGSVANALDLAQAKDIASAFIEGDTQNGGPGKVVNAVTIRGKDQVQIRVNISEVQRSVLKQLGVKTDGNWDVGNTVIAGAVVPEFLGTPPSSYGGFRTTGSNSTFQAVVQALERTGVVRTLAEPTVTAVSGETSDLLVGGEIPIVTGYSCATVQGGGTGPCTASVTFKKYGVSLTFTPIVMSEGRISVRIITEVSELDVTQTIRLGESTGGVTLPSFKVRRSETTVELPSGGTLVTAGLIRQTDKHQIQGFPGLKNVPILGSLFRSREYQKEETELMISVTPYIVKPVSPSSLVRPTDGFVPSSDTQATFLGKINKIYPGTGGGKKKVGQTGVNNSVTPGFIND